jgi:TPP-dependent pyruvate/acetoin dehydrogenase alpha subunit
VKRCPLVVIVENNHWAYSTPTSMQTAAASFVEKAPGYGVAGEQVDGNDVLAVYGAARRAVERARAGEGVTLLELLTYRRLGHAQHDNQSYQPAEEIERWARGNDPLDRFAATLTGNGWAEPGRLAEIDEEIDRELDAAVEEAEVSPLPEPEEALEGVYAGARAAVPWTRLSPPDPTRG